MNRRHLRTDATVLALFLTACAVIAVAQLAEIVLRSWAAWPVLAAGAGLGWYRLRRRPRIARPRLKVLPGTVVHPPDLSGEVARLQAENDRLRADLADARESAQVAWDAAAAVAPRQVEVLRSDLRDRLLADPMSGVRPLFPGDDHDRRS